MSFTHKESRRWKSNPLRAGYEPTAFRSASPRYVVIMERVIRYIAIALITASIVVGLAAFTYAAYWWIFVLWGPSWPQAIYGT